MEISAGGQLEVRITAADVGKRVSVRRWNEDVAGGEKFTDTVGVLTSWDNGVLLITRRSGESVRIAESSLVAGKVVPAAPARRRGPAASYEELSRIAARAWQPVERERLGDWELRASAGFTRRANSVLPVGEPGLPLDEALTVVRDWYADRGLPAYIQTATGAEGTQELLCAELEARGWTREVTAELWIGALAPLTDREVSAEVVLSREADAAWLSRYQRKGLSEVALKVLGSGPSVWFATVPGAAGRAPAAIGRCVVDGRWAGFAAVEVDPAQRRRGLAGAVMTALARRALEEGASAAWLQVETDNTAARALYAGLGFGTHHAYHHYRWASESGARGKLGVSDVRGELAGRESGVPGDVGAPGEVGAPGRGSAPGGSGTPDVSSAPGGITTPDVSSAPGGSDVEMSGGSGAGSAGGPGGGCGSSGASGGGGSGDAVGGGGTYRSA